MRMNMLETLSLNNPLYSAIKRYVEAPILMRLGGRLDGARVLEIGCGNGVGTEVLVRRFGAAEVEAFDFDERMVGRAQRRLRRMPPGRVRVRCGDAAKIDAPAKCYDAVVDFAVLHHIPAWQRAVREVARVLKPGGVFLFEEVTAQWLQRWPWRVLFEHPLENRFSAGELVQELEASGLAVGTRFELRGGGDFVFGAAERQAVRHARGHMPKMCPATT